MGMVWTNLLITTARGEQLPAPGSRTDPTTIDQPRSIEAAFLPVENIPQPR